MAAFAVLAGVLQLGPTITTAKADGSLDWAYETQDVLEEEFSSGLPAFGGISGDFDGSGAPDLLVRFVNTLVYYDSDAIAAGFGSATGTISVPSDGNADLSQAADGDGDGRDDLLMPATDGFYVLPGTASGPGEAELIAFEDPREAAFGQWDGDAAAELFVTTATLAGPKLHVVQLDTAGWPITEITDLVNVFELIPADLDLDGDEDFIAASPDFSVAVYVQDEGSFSYREYPGVPAVDAAVGELTGDGVPDIATAAGILPGTGDGGFGSLIPLVSTNARLEVHDVNGDGLDDLVVPTFGFRMRFQTAGGGLTSECQHPYLRVYEVADLDEDGLIDVLAPNAGVGSSFRILWGATRGASAVSISPNSTAYRFWGEDVSFHGHVDSIQACPDVAPSGAGVALYRSDAGGPYVQVDSGLSAANGSYSLSDRPAVIGTYRYEVRFAGTDLLAGSASQRIDVIVQQPRTGVVEVAFDRQMITYGRAADYTVTLNPYQYTENLDVDLYLYTGGEPLSFLETVTVDADTGTYQGTIDGLQARSWLVAMWSGDELWGEAEGETSLLKVQVRFRGRLVGFVGREGKYRIFRRGDHVGYVTVVVPSIRQYERVRVQRYDGRRWRAFASGDFRPNRDGVLALVLNGAALRPGERYRIFARHPGGTYLEGAATRWAYFRTR